jgi:hypothetical protein
MGVHFYDAELTKYFRLSLQDGQIAAADVSTEIPATYGSITKSIFRTWVFLEYRYFTP